MALTFAPNGFGDTDLYTSSDLVPNELARQVPENAAAEYARIPEAVRRFGLSRSRIYLLAGQRKIRVIKVGKAALVDLASVREFMRGQPLAEIRAPKGAARLASKVAPPAMSQGGRP